MVEVDDAAAVLLDATARKRYDAERRNRWVRKLMPRLREAIQPNSRASEASARSNGTPGARPLPQVADRVHREASRARARRRRRNPHASSWRGQRRQASGYALPMAGQSICTCPRDARCDDCVVQSVRWLAGCAMLRGERWRRGWRGSGRTCAGGRGRRTKMRRRDRAATGSGPCGGSACSSCSGDGCTTGGGVVERGAGGEVAEVRDRARYAR